MAGILASESAKRIGYLVGAMVVCDDCAYKSEDRTPLYFVNVYPYRQTCHACNVEMCRGQSGAWCELFPKSKPTTITIVGTVEVCECCMLAAVNGDVCDCGDDHDRKVSAGLDRLTENRDQIVPGFNSETGEGINEFTWRPCECCRSHLGGGRHTMSILRAVP
jgi:hypothetical protein